MSVSLEDLNGRTEAVRAASALAVAPEAHAEPDKNGWTLTAVEPTADTASEPIQYLSPTGELLPGKTAPISVEETKRLYIAMLRIRMIDERMVMLQRQGRIGFYIGSSGEEACIIGPIAVLRPADWLFPCYRENGGYLLRGFPLQRFMDNLFGNGNDTALGRQMPNHITWKDSRIASVSSPIGTQIPQAVGAAHAARLSGKDDIAMTYFGEGATSSNDFHTGLNFAGVWKAPVIFVCRNNQWAISVPAEKQCAAVAIADKAAGYGMPGIRVDGNDLFACYAVTSEAAARARAGEGPTMIEALTYRVQGHSTSDDPSVYRPAALVEPWRARDPLLRVRKYLASQNAWSDADEEQLRAAVDEEVKAAVLEAEKTAPPPVQTLFSDVFAELPWHLKEELVEVESRGAGHTAADGAFPL
jgi:2-oxoisovalerate dehydrogenase E1 component alpha subunit